MEDNQNDKKRIEIEDAEFIEIEPTNSLKQRLHKSSKSKIIFGVCGGLGEYYNISPIIFRALFLISVLFTTWTIFVYFLLSVFIPGETPKEIKHQKLSTFFGYLLIILLLGSFVLNSSVILQYFIFDINNESLYGLLFLLLGYYIQSNGDKFANYIEPDIFVHKLCRIKSKKMIAGVCAGLSYYFNTNLSFIRTLFILLSIFTFGLFVIIYLVLFLTTSYVRESSFEKH